MKNIIILGSPGAGKGTQASQIAEAYDLVHLSSGELLRKEVQLGGPLAEEIKQCQEDGVLVPDDLVTKLIIANIKQNAGANGFVLDGYPRNTHQATELENFININLVLSLDISEEEALKRLLLRGKTSGRSDDNTETIKQRFRVYKQETQPLIDYYIGQEKLISINGEQSIADIFTALKKEIDKI